MNRPIEFRAWDKFYKKWFPEDDMHPIGGFYYIGGMQDDHYILCQYTGLNDRNGTKIFEGDIVKVNNINNSEDIFISEVIFEMGAWKVGSIHIYTFLQMAVSLEVIGNIFQNPELLDI